ncbi:MAG TPA: ribonucleoside-diphosphate reductase subunit alpha, partial [Thioalkalivibrio sp.]|nr:ribonucleoside-diphosphate reductase subunit alpha [Thioalkalivibrio sp.]
QEPNYSQVTARLLMDNLRREALSFLAGLPQEATQAEMGERYPEYFQAYIKRAAQLELVDSELTRYDLDALGKALKPERDLQFTYLGLQTLYDRYFIHSGGTRFELPQAFFMRVAMGLAINEVDREARAVEFYELLSSFDFMSSTPTLFNSGTLRPQLSSCYLTTVPDDLDGIFGAIKDNALLSKFAGGLGNDWTRVRGMGAHIKGTNGKSQGVVPFLKVANDTAVAVNQGGKRKGAVCAYLETWHIDVEEFIELRKNTGDDRRRTHDMNTANWIPDLFMQRVVEEGEWTLFSPSETGDLHDLVGEAFAKRYAEYEEKAARGEIKVFKKIKAVDLWRKMLAMLFETGHPWMTFKDPCNLRSPQSHVGVVHSSNLCCIAADQRVVTDRGMVTVGELYATGGKNKVVGLDGVYDASEMLLPRPNAPMVRIETREGYSHKVTPDHKVWVKDTGWVEAQDLKAGDKLLIQQLEGLWGEQHDPDLSYVMGLIAGDGTFGKSNVFIDIWRADFDVLPQVQQTVHALLSGNTALKTTSTNQPEFRVNEVNNRARLASAPLRRLLAEHDFTPETKTRVPELVWRGDRETVSAYLRGLYQADGHLQSGTEITTVVLASKDLAFIQDLQILWANFGVKTSINQMRDQQYRPIPDGKGGTKSYWSQPLYRLLITSIQGCRIAEAVTGLAAHKRSQAAKHHLCNIEKPGYQQKLYATFTQCTALPNEDAYCLMVDSETHAWTVNGLITKNTEITLNTSDDEIAVCNLGSVNLAAHVKDGALDLPKLERTVTTAMRMLDNVIDYNYYSVPQARRSNLRHRPVGLGIMGFQDALYEMRLPYASEDAVTFADTSMEAVSYYAIQASTHLAEERGRYATYEGSLWSQGILPIDSIDRLAEARGQYLQQDTSRTLDWDALRERVQTVGMRNSNTMAIAPTATISNICGVSQSIEPTYQNLFVKSNLSGEFTVINPYLVHDLKERGLWDEVMVNDLKYYDGSVQPLDRVPADLKALYATAFELDTRWLVEAASRRQKWIDQGQSLNLYMAEPSGKKLDNLYKLAWMRGLKTTYYLRSMGATHVEKSTVTDTGRANKLNAVNGNGSAQAAESSAPKACSILDPDCEACQ